MQGSNIEMVTRPGTILAEHDTASINSGAILANHRAQSVQSGPMLPELSIPRLSLKYDLQETYRSFTFEDDLFNCGVYRRALKGDADSHSLVSTARRTMSWSMLSRFSLAKVSNISVLALPLYADDISNKEHYHFGIDDDQKTIMPKEEGDELSSGHDRKELSQIRKERSQNQELEDWLKFSNLLTQTDKTDRTIDDSPVGAIEARRLLPHVKKRASRRTVAFNPRIQIHEVWCSLDFDRMGPISTCNQLTPKLAQTIKVELNEFKMVGEMIDNDKSTTDRRIENVGS